MDPGILCWLCENSDLTKWRPHGRVRSRQAPYLKNDRKTSHIGQTFIPLFEKLVKTQHGRIPIDRAILDAIEHHFIAENRELKMPKCESEETLFWPKRK